MAGTLALMACGVAVSAVEPQSPVNAQLPQLPVTRIDDRTPAAELDAPHAVSLSIGQAQPIRDVLLQLVRGTAFSLVADDRVDGTFAGELRDLTLRQALEATLFPRDLDYDLHGSVIRVFPRKPATRLFDVNYLNVRRSAVVSTGIEPVNVTTGTTADALDELTRGVERLLSPLGRAHVDRGAGLVQVTDYTDRLDQVGVYLEAVQLRATRQVRLDARVFEVTLNRPGQSIDWTEIAARSGAGIRPAAAGIAGIRVTDFAELMQAIATQGSVRTIATPQWLATNNEPAIMRVGTAAVHFATAEDKDQGPAQPVPEGLTLVVTAQIAADGIVQLHLAPTYAREAGTRAGAASALAVDAAETVARVQDGQTIILSGFLRDRARAAQARGVAGFFGARAHETERTELVILLTPTVVIPGAAATARTR